jgi:hypothetical protein
MPKRLTLLILLTAAAGCRTVGSGSDVQSAPSVSGNPVPQGGPRLVNHCNQGGHEGPLVGRGWAYDLREGCFLDCKSKEALIQDFLGQLRRHRVYGDIELLRQKDPVGAAMAARYQEYLKGRGIKPHSLARLERKDILDGSRWQSYGIKPGDIFLNMNFGQPNHAGIFYSKRGIAHARLVVDVKDDQLTTFDGGWQAFSKMPQVGSQIIWLRPRQEHLGQGDIASILRWAKTMEPLPYDNTLVDDLKEYRAVLHARLDQGASPKAARDEAMTHAKTNQKPPFGFAESFDFKAPSGLYCSEGTAAIFSYLGFRQYGENILDQLTAYSADGNLPDWTIYQDALSGFGADSDPDIYMMHQLFYGYFKTFDQGRQLGIIEVPGMANARSASFAEAAKANFLAVAADQGASDHLRTQIEAVRAALAQDPKQADAVKQIDQMLGGFQVAAQTLSERSGSRLNLSQALFGMFYANDIYGPHSFFENSKYFELKGVFYNSDLKGKGQALYIADWWLQTVGQARQTANISTTLYRITGDASLPADRCIVAEPAPVMPTE